LNKNLPASVRQRLTNKAKDADRPFQEVLQYFAMERFLYRLTQSRHSDKFVLKGALRNHAKLNYRILSPTAGGFRSSIRRGTCGV